MDDAHAANVALSDIHALGVGISVDDFGTGYSSLLYLRRFPVDALKLDRFFVAGMDKSEEDIVIVRAVIELAHSLKRVAIAEGIETESQRKLLASMGCDFAQGFLWSPAVPADQVDDMVARMTLNPSRTPRVPSPEPGHTAPQGDSVAPPAADQLSVLLVDDSEGDRSLLTERLNACGRFTVVGEASDGGTAVVLTGQLQPDVVLLDLAMPGINGLETLPQLLKVSPNTQVIVLSGYLSQGLKDQAMAAGAASILEKSVGYDEVIKHLDFLNEN
jgi:CheY-like chemotaxis protein